MPNQLYESAGSEPTEHLDIERTDKNHEIEDSLGVQGSVPMQGEFMSKIKQQRVIDEISMDTNHFSNLAERMRCISVIKDFSLWTGVLAFLSGFWAILISLTDSSIGVTLLPAFGIAFTLPVLMKTNNVAISRIYIFTAIAILFTAFGIGASLWLGRMFATLVIFAFFIDMFRRDRRTKFTHSLGISFTGLILLTAGIGWHFLQEFSTLFFIFVFLSAIFTLTVSVFLFQLKISWKINWVILGAIGLLVSVAGCYIFSPVFVFTLMFAQIFVPLLGYIANKFVLISQLVTGTDEAEKPIATESTKFFANKACWQPAVAVGCIIIEISGVIGLLGAINTLLL